MSIKHELPWKVATLTLAALLLGGLFSGCRRDVPAAQAAAAEAAAAQAEQERVAAFRYAETHLRWGIIPVRVLELDYQGRRYAFLRYGAGDDATLAPIDSRPLPAGAGR